MVSKHGNDPSRVVPDATDVGGRTGCVARPEGTQREPIQAQFNQAQLGSVWMIYRHPF